MASDSKSAPLLPAATTTAGEVKAFLERNPAFLAEHPELCNTIIAPAARRGDNVIDVQQFMIGRLQGEIGRLKSLQSELVKIGQSNLSSQAQIHTAVLALLDARTFEHLIEIITKSLAHHLEVDVVGLAIEASVAVKGTRGVRVLETGTIDKLLGEREIVLRDAVEAEGMIYGRHAAGIRSDALLRLTLSPLGPGAMLALGSRTTRRFQPGQGTELLCFFARVVARSLKTWLDLPG